MGKVNYTIENINEYCFDDSQSLFNITEEEYVIVISRRQSPEKVLLIERLRYIIQQEYRKYCNSNVRKAPIGEDFKTYCSSLRNNSKVQNAQTAISKLLKSYNSQEKRLSIRYNPQRINNKLLKLLGNDYWFDSLLYYLFNHKTSTTAKRSILNIINRYYCALTNIRQLHELDIELERQRNILYPFVLFTHNNRDAWSFSNDIFIRKIIIALYKNQEHKLNDLFRIKRLLGCLEYTYNESSKNYFEFDLHTPITIEEISVPTIEPWVIYLRDCMDKVRMVTIPADAIQNIRKATKEGDDFLADLLNILKEIYKGYVNKKYETWANFLENHAKVLEAESWYTYLRYFLKELGINRSGKDELEPDYCYDYIVYRHVMARSELVSESSIFDKQLTDRLIDVLHNNKSKDQSRFYEDCFGFMFILKKIQNNEDTPLRELTSNDPVWKDSLEFLNPVLNDSFINTSVLSIEQVKRLLKIIISNDLFYKNMRAVPSAFTKYNISINATILLKLIGLLKGLNINWNGLPLLKYLPAAKIIQNIFNPGNEKAIDSLRKHISDTPDSKYYTKENRKIAIDIINRYCKDIFSKKK